MSDMIPVSTCSPLSLISLLVVFANHTNAIAQSAAVSPNSVSASVVSHVVTAPTLVPGDTATTTAVQDFVQSIRTVPQLETPPHSFSAPQPVLPVFEPTTYAGSETDNVAAQEDQLIALINRERVSEGLNSLTPDPILSSVARGHSEDMAVRGYFDHHAPTGEPVTPMDRYLAAAPERPDYAMVGENIYYRSNTDSVANYASEAHDAFMNSPGHRANVLMPQYTSVGVGIYRNPSTGEFWVTEMFCSLSQPK
jgi:uncharacterized protein YkwD